MTCAIFCKPTHHNAQKCTNMCCDGPHVSFVHWGAWVLVADTQGELQPPSLVKNITWSHAAST